MRVGKWSEEEVKLLVALHPTTTIREIAQRLDRTERMISNKAHCLGLKKHDGRLRDAFGRYVEDPERPRSRARRRKVVRPERQPATTRRADMHTTETMPIPTCLHAFFQKHNLPFTRRYDG